MASQVSSWTLIGDFFVQECCVHGTDLESHGPTSLLCDDPIPLMTIAEYPNNDSAFPKVSMSIFRNSTQEAANSGRCAKCQNCQNILIFNTNDSK